MTVTEEGPGLVLGVPLVQLAVEELPAGVCVCVGGGGGCWLVIVCSSLVPRPLPEEKGLGTRLSMHILVCIIIVAREAIHWRGCITHYNG